MIRRLVLPVFAALAAVACVAQPAFVCKSNPDCISESGAAGICEVGGSCSFFDATCQGTLRRYADGATGGLASTCVAAKNQCIAALSVGGSHSCALRTDGAVYCWGRNDSGQVGDGTTDDATTAKRVQGLPAGHAVVQVTAAREDTCALLDDGTVWCWGLNDAHNLGQCGAQAPFSATALEVPTWSLDPQNPAIPRCDAATPFTATQIANGGEHACAIGKDGDLYCWGENTKGAQGGQCGQDPTMFDDVPGPLRVDFPGAVQVGCGDEYTCVVKDENSVWCFGANDLNELGDATTSASFVPVNVAGISDAKTLAMDDETPCIVTKTGGLFCWGNGTTGIFGADLEHNVGQATRVGTCAQAYGGGTSETICITQTDGSLQCFGANDQGQCGVGVGDAAITAPTPSKLVTASLVAVGGDHTCATTTDGALWCWGANDRGQLGDGRASQTPVLIPERIDFPCP